MLTKFINFTLQSATAKYFIISFLLSFVLSVIGYFSIFSWLAVFISSFSVVIKHKFFDDKLGYDQRQQVKFNSLLLSSVLWSVFAFKDLQDSASMFALVFVIIAASGLLFFNSLKNKIVVVAPILLTFLLLLFFFLEPTPIALAVIAFVFTGLMLFLNAFKKLPEAEEEGMDSAAKMEYIAKIDGLKTENKKLQEDLKQTEIDLSAAEMAKMEFLATMSHEIRTPMNGIIPLLDILLDSELSDFQRDYLTTAHASATELQKLIDDLLDFSKVEAGKISIEVRGLKVSRIMKAVKESYRQASEKKGLKIKVNIHSNVSPFLRGDPTRLRQVLSNLMSNAIKFSDKGSIKITAKKIKDYSTKEIVRFEVIDQGIGLDKETADNIFLPFTQEDGSSTRKFGGTGLGLAISKKIVELMHGTIGVTSEKDKGSVFYFDIPLLKSAGETEVGTKEKAGYQAILVNTNPLLINKMAQKLKDAEIAFQKALGLSQAYEMYEAINNVSNRSKNVLVFFDFETAGKHARNMCQDLAKDETMTNLFTCIITENRHLAGIPRLPNIHLLTKDDVIEELINKIEVNQASIEAFKTDDVKQEEETTSTSDAANEPVQDISSVIPEILLVEDNEVNLKVAEKLIQYIGYPFDFALNGQEAFEKVKKTRYRMILMDCQMPVMDGYKCTTKIRDYERAAGLNHTPILAMTANAMLGDREKCLDAGMDDYMSKPLNRYILEKTLKKWDPLAKSNENKVFEQSHKAQDETLTINKSADDKPEVPQQTQVSNLETTPVDDVMDEVDNILETINQDNQSTEDANVNVINPESLIVDATADEPVKRNEQIYTGKETVAQEDSQQETKQEPAPQKEQEVVIAKNDIPVIPKKPPPVINSKWLSTKALEEIKEFMGDEIKQLLEMFEQETPAILNKMKIALKNRNIEEVQKMAHMLKSTSANIGANGLSFFSRKMELAANNKEENVLVPTFNKISKAYSLTSAEIEKYMQSLD